METTRRSTPPLPNRLRVLSCAVMSVLGGVLAGPLQAMSLTDAVRTTLSSNPQVGSARAERRAAGHDVREARAGYYPSLDVTAALGREHSDIDSLKDAGQSSRTLTRRELGLTLSLMLYDGKATSSEVDRRRALLDAATSGLDDTREGVALRTAEVYLEVLKDQRLVKLAEDNVATHREILDKVTRSVKRGVGQKADQQQAEGRLALARSILVARQGRLEQAIVDYVRVVGEAPGELVDPEAAPRRFAEAGDGLSDLIRQAIEDGTQTAVTQHPALNRARAEVTAADAAARGAKAAYLPRLDVEVSATRDDNIAGVQGDRDLEALMLVARWNAYRGGADQAREKALVERRFAAKDVAADTQRAVQAGVSIAFQAKATSERRIAYLRRHVQASRDTVDSYRKQFRLGRRTLLDVLNTESELFTARSDLVTGLSDDLFNQYLVEASQGQLVRRLGLAVAEE